MSDSVKRVLSGMRPTGRLHLGHLEGVLRNWVRLQDEYKCYYFVADWHALTDRLDTSEIQDSIHNMVIDWLAAGVDPSKATLFVQSDLAEVSELTLLLAMCTPVGWLERCPTYKDKVADIEGKEGASMGLLGYPVLMTADIVIQKAHFVPVGEDQIPHLELAREIVRRFAFNFGEVFPEPQPLLTQASKLPGLDGRKMSKSYDNAIYISDAEDETARKVGTMLTDPERPYLKDPGHPENCPVCMYQKIYNAPEVEELEARCRAAEIGCRDCKTLLAERMNESLRPIRGRRAELASDPGRVADVLNDGLLEARRNAREVMAEVREHMRIKYAGSAGEVA